MIQTITQTGNLPDTGGFSARAGNSPTATRRSWLSFARMFALLFVLLPGIQASAQIVTTTYDFAANSTGWTGNFARATSVSFNFYPCVAGDPMMRRNLWSSATTGQMISPGLVGNNQGLVTVNYQYRCANYGSNTPATGAWGNFNVQYSQTSATGPWTTIAGSAITNETQTGSCLSKSVSFTPPTAGGTIWFRWNAAWTSGDYWLTFDNIVISQGPAPTPCVGTPTPGNTLSSLASVCSGGTTTLTLQNSTLGTGITYQWQSSPDNATWNNIAGATASSYVATVPAATWYRCNVTCSAGPSTGTSNPVQVTLNPPLNCICASNATNAGFEDIFNVTLGPLNNSSDCITAAPGPGSVLGQYANYRTLPPVNLNKGTPLSLSVTAASCSGWFDRSFKVFMDGNQDGDFNDAGEELFVSPLIPGSANSIPASIVSSLVTIPATFLDGNTVMRVVMQDQLPASITSCGTYGYGETEDYLVNLVTPSICTGTPPASVTNSSSTSVCPGANFTLSLANPYSLSGFTFQWQSSPNNSTWTNITGATANSLVQSQTAATWYRCVVTCTNSGFSTNTTSIQVNMSPVFNCYCNSNATAPDDGDIFNVTVGTLNNTSTCISVGGAGSIPNQYSNYRAIAPPNLAQSTVVPISIQISHCGASGYNNNVAVYIDYNQDGDFNDAGETVFTGGPTSLFTETLNGSFQVPCTALPGNTGMRVVMVDDYIGEVPSPCGLYGYGETEDYIVNIVVPPACSGSPAASNALASVATTCPGVPFNLSLSTSYASCDFSLQWERSTDNISYFPIGGATSAVQTIPSQLAASYYRAVITCIPSGQTTTSSSVFVAQSPLLGCYCVSSASNTGFGEIVGVTLGSISNSSTCATVAPGAGSINQRYSNYTSLQTDLVKTVNNAMSISLLNCTSGAYNNLVKVWIDYNQDGDHLDAGELVYTSPFTSVSTTPSTLNFNFTVPIGAANGLTLMRIVTHEDALFTSDVQPCNSLAVDYSWGETEDYLVNIITPPTCSGIPFPGTLPATQQILNNTSTVLNPTGLGIELNLTYEWQESDDNGVGDAWAPAVGGSGGNTPIYTTPNLSTTRWYRLRVECTTTTDVAFSNSIQITTVGGASCADPYVIGSLPFTLNFSSNGAGNDIGTQTSSCSNLYGGGQDVVFQFTAPSAGNYEISVVNTSNTRFIGWFLKSGANCNLTTLGSQLGCAVSTGTYNSAHNVVAIPSAGTYYVVVDYAAPVTQSNFFIRIRQNPAAPANDNCATAAAITQSGLPSCGAPVIGTLAGATSSGVPVQCSGGNADDDVWYSFVATSDAAVIDVATTTNGVVESGANIAWEFFSGNCGALNPLFCRNASASRGVTENATVVGLTIGQTYYIRLYDMDAGYGSALGNFTICIYTPPPPANNECSGATILAVNPGCVTTTGNTVAATQSLPASACNGFTGNADDDVWYQFTIAAPTNINIEVTSLNNTFDPVVELFTGSCGSPSTFLCADNSLQGGVERITRAISAGTYFIRLYHFGVGTGAGGAHSICVTSTSPAIAPINDNTCTAFILPVTNACSPEGPYSSSAATRTLNLTLAQQGDGTPNDDVWFRFTTDNVTSTVTINVQGGSGYDAVFQVFEMSNCKTLTGIFPPVDVTFANGLESQTVFGLSPNTTYYIRVFDWAGTNPTGQFTICTFVTPPPPNDAAVNAILLSQQNSATCFSPTFGYTINGTAGDATAAPCAGNADDNVWYKFIATNTTATITVTGTQGFDPVVNLRGGNLPGTSLQCANATGADGTETIAATGLTQGATYYIQVYGVGANPVAWGTFEICVFGTALPPINDNCAGAIALPNASPCAPVTGILTGATQSQAPSTCNFNTSPAAFDVWYSFIASSPQATLTPVSTSGTGDMVVQMFSGNCGTLNPLGCIDADPAPGVENLVINGLTPGQTYYARVYIFSANGPGTSTGPDPNFTICYTGVPPANDNPCGATLTTVSSGRVDILTSNLGATNVTGLSPTMPNGSFSSWNNDVWFRSIVPANGVIAINVLGIGFSDTKLRLYTSSDNTCNGTLTPVAWDDDNGAGLSSYIYHSGLTPGSTVFYAVDGFSAANFGQFRLNVNDGWLWTGAGGFTYNGQNNWINQGATDATPAPSSTVTVSSTTGWASSPNTVIINIPAVTNQPVYTANTTIGGVKFVSGVFTQAKFTVNAGAIVTLNGTTFAGTGRGITGTSSGGRIEGNGRLDIGAAVSGETVLVNYPTRFRLAVTALGTANVQSNGNMIFDNGASLYSGQTPPNSQVTGNITYRRQGNTSAVVYNFWSSPISNGLLSSLAAPGYIPNLYQYNTPTATGLDYLGSQAGWQALTPGTPMVPGKGYIATGAGLANFTGLPNQNQPIGPALQNGAGNVNNFNLVGNPYPAPVSASQFITANAGAITGSIYIWDDDASAGVNYAAGDFIVTNGIGTVNGPNSGAPFSGNIGSCQGFFVEKVPAFSGNIVFNHGMKVYGTNSEFFNVEDASRLRLRMENSNGVGTETLLAFTADATDGVDPMYDATRLQGNATLSLYTFNGTGEYVIQAWPTLATERIFPLGTVNTVTGPSSITVNQFENFDPSTVVYLEDVANGVFHNLTENPTYNFNNTGLNTGVNGEEVRFKLHFRAPIAVASSMDCSGMEMGKIIVANPNTTPVALEVVNENNAVIATAAAFVGEHEVSGLAAGAYTLNLSYADGASTSKTAVVESNGMTTPATFIASATTVSIADAIIEFQGTAQGATQYIWNFGDGSAEVTGDINPVHAYNAPGVYTVTFTALNNGCGSTATTTITVTNDATGIGSAATANGFTIFPNPASEVANLLLNVDRSTTDVTISIHDAAGRLVSTQQVNEVRSGAMIALPIEALSNGVYQVTVEGKSFRNTGRLTIAK